MATLIDSHCHLNLIDLTPFPKGLPEVIQNAKDNGVSQFLCVAIDLEHHTELMEIANRFSDIHISVGIHPNHDESQVVERDTLLDMAKDKKVIAIGETGLDYFRSSGDLAWQQQRFITHIEAAIDCQKPLIIHSREAKADTIRFLKENQADKIGGVMHCFAEDWEMAKAAMDLNFYISFSGIVTFKSAKILQEVAKKMPLDRILIETDCPYLAPTPHRGKPNYPAYVKLVAEHIAQLRGESFEEIANASTANFHKLFLS